jgi:hypothetical protein
MSGQGFGIEIELANWWDYFLLRSFTRSFSAMG